MDNVEKLVGNVIKNYRKDTKTWKTYEIIRVQHEDIKKTIDELEGQGIKFSLRRHLYHSEFKTNQLAGEVIDEMV